MLDSFTALAAAAAASSAAPQSFVAFCEWVGASLTPGQRVLALVAYDGVDPCDLPPAERELARKLFGPRVERVSPAARAVLVAVCGARGGKSYVLGGLKSLHAALTVDLSPLAPGEIASALLVAPDLKLAKQPLRYVKGAAQACPAIKDRVVGETAESVLLERDDGHRVAVECLAATRGGSAVRGRSLVSAYLDEAAFFYDSNYVINDSEIFRAVAPRVLRGGSTTIASTPWAELGLLYDFHRENWGRPETALVAHAPTLLLRDDEHTRGYVAREKLRDPQNALREFDARFMPAGTGQFFAGRSIEEACDQAIDVPMPKRPHLIYCAGADFGFRSDASSLVVVERERDTYRVTDLVEILPQPGQPLVPSETVARCAERAIRYGCRNVWADAHYRESIQEHLGEHGLSLVDAPAGATGKAEVYQVARSLLHEGRVRLPAGEARLLQQLREVTARPTAGGGVSIQQPRKPGGGHGDMVSALVLALWAASREHYVPPPTPEGIGEQIDREFFEKVEREQRGGDPWFDEPADEIGTGKEWW